MIILSVQSVYSYEDLYEQDYMSLFSLFFPGDDEFVLTPFYGNSAADFQIRVDEFASRWNDFQSGLDFTGCISCKDSGEQRLTLRWRRGMVALISDPSIDSVALGYVILAPAPYEWEGDRHAIGMETVFAMDYLTENPDTLDNPYSANQNMHRLKAQEECITILDGNPSDSVSALYDSLYQEALLYPDTLVNYFARELDSEELVYLVF